MTATASILRSLDPYHQRIGYLGALTTVANRGLDTAEHLQRRMIDLLYREVRPDDPAIGTLLDRLSERRRAALKTLMSQHPKGGVENPFATEEETLFWYLSALWLCDDVMPSAIGFVPPQKVSRIIDLGRWCGILRKNLELSDRGFVIRLLLEDLQQPGQLAGQCNLINAGCRMAVTLNYFRNLLRAESLWPFLICELVERSDAGRELATRGPEGLLAAGVDRMLAVLGSPSDPAGMLPLRGILEFRRAISGRESTAENYLRPRLEMLVDLGLLQKLAEGNGKRAFTYRVTDATRVLADELRPLASELPSVDEFLDRHFFASMGRVFDRSLRPADSLEERLLLFVRAYSPVSREIGLTPGSTIAEMACLTAWEGGVGVEVSELIDTVYDSMESPWGEYLRMSGGSRFDREFVIRIRDGLAELLEARVAESGR